MTIKYIYVLKKLNMFPKLSFRFISDNYVNLFHPPIDSFILKDVLNNSTTTWSSMDYEQYERIRKDLKENGFDFIKEFHDWNEISESQKEYDGKSYAKYLENRKHQGVSVDI